MKFKSFFFFEQHIAWHCFHNSGIYSRKLQSSLFHGLVTELFSLYWQKWCCLCNRKTPFQFQFECLFMHFSFFTLESALSQNKTCAHQFSIMYIRLKYIWIYNIIMLHFNWKGKKEMLQIQPNFVESIFVHDLWH